jgi:hypothetical protein
LALINVLAWFPSIKIWLDIPGRKFNPWGTAIHNTAESQPVTLAKSGHSEDLSNRITRHQETDIKSRESKVSKQQCFLRVTCKNSTSYGDTDRVTVSRNVIAQSLGAIIWNEG